MNDESKRSALAMGCDYGQKTPEEMMSPDFNHHFLAVVFQIGLQNITPRQLALMLPSYDGMTTEHIKSHLQKCRNESSKCIDEIIEMYSCVMSEIFHDMKGDALSCAVNGDVSMSRQQISDLSEVSSLSTKKTLSYQHIVAFEGISAFDKHHQQYFCCGKRKHFRNHQTSINFKKTKISM